MKTVKVDNILRKVSKMILIFIIVIMIPEITCHAYNDAYDKIHGSNTYEHNGITLSPGSSSSGNIGFTTNKGETGFEPLYDAYGAGVINESTVLTTGLGSTIGTDIQPWQHIYNYKKISGVVPISEWRMYYGNHYCIHGLESLGDNFSGIQIIFLD